MNGFLLFFFRNNCQHQSSKIVWNLGRKYGRNFRIFIRLTEQTRDSYSVLPNETFSSDRLFVPKVNKSSKKFAEIEISMKSSTFFVLDMLSKPTFRLKIGQKYKNFSELLESQRVVPNAKSCSQVTEHNWDWPLDGHHVTCIYRWAGVFFWGIHTVYIYHIFIKEPISMVFSYPSVRYNIESSKFVQNHLRILSSIHVCVAVYILKFTCPSCSQKENFAVDKWLN